MAEFENIQPDDPLFQQEMRRRALEKLQEYEKRGIRPKPQRKKRLPPLPPGANDELWPGGPSVETGEIRLARSNMLRRVAGGSLA